MEEITKIGEAARMTTEEAARISERMRTRTNEPIKVNLDTTEAVENVRALRKELELLGDKANLAEILEMLMETRRNIRCMTVDCVFWKPQDRCHLPTVNLVKTKCNNYLNREQWRKMREIPEGTYPNIRGSFSGD